MEEFKWGIIGCGDVTEKKSGPAFNKIPHSSLLAVMRRDTAKAKDYARRHNVPLWFDNASALLQNDLINAVYIATPPSSHCKLSLAAFAAGKNVYVEKPMALNASQAKTMVATANHQNIKFSVAHYRRQQPKFLKIKALLEQKSIGEIINVSLVFSRIMISDKDLEEEKTKWRIDPLISGGGLFHDMAPHQLDLLLYFFGHGKILNKTHSVSQELYTSPDKLDVKMKFSNNILFSGKWNFNCKSDEVADSVKIIGSKGSFSFTVFDDNIITISKENIPDEILEFPQLEHVQQPMIEAVAKFFMGKGVNPCTGEDGVVVMEWIDEIVN